MKKIRCILCLEAGRNLSRLYIGVILVFTLIAVIIFQAGLDKFNASKTSQESFVKNEQKRVAQYYNYLEYAKIGFNLISSPSIMMSFFHNSTTFSDMVTFIDAGARLILSKPQGEGNIFEKPTGAVLDFSWYLLVIGSLLMMCWAFFAFKNVPYMRFLMNFADSRSIFWGIMLSRVLLLTVSLAFIFLVLGLQLVSNGITPGKGEMGGILLFFLVAEMTLLFVLLIGSFLGTCKSTVKGGIMAAVLWLTLFLLWPEFLNSIFSGAANRAMKPLYMNEIQKMNIVIDFEASAYEKTKGLKNPNEILELTKKLIESYWEGDYKKIEQLEKGIIERAKTFSARFHLWSIFTPATFYKSVNNEISSRGYLCYISFYIGANNIQRGFLRYYFDKRFYENDPQVKPFLKDEEYVFQLKSSLPQYFSAGLLLNLLYILIALGCTYSRFMRAVFPKPAQSIDFDGIALVFKKRRFYSFSLWNEDNSFLNQFFSALWLKKTKNVKMELTLDGKEITPGERIIYLPGPKKFPSNLKHLDLALIANRLTDRSAEEIKKLKNSFLKNKMDRTRIGDIDYIDNAVLLLASTRYMGRSIYLLDDFIDRRYSSGIGDLMKNIVELKEEGKIIIEVVFGDIYHQDFDKLTGISLENSRYVIKHVIDNEEAGK